MTHNFTRTGSFEFGHFPAEHDGDYNRQYVVMKEEMERQQHSNARYVVDDSDDDVIRMVAPATTPSGVRPRHDGDVPEKPNSYPTTAKASRYRGKHGRKGPNDFSKSRRGKLTYHQLEPSEYSSRFVVVDKHVKPKDLVEKIFKKEWFANQPPKLIISVTGSAANFQMKPNLKTVFRRGIAQAAKATSAWIITGGTNTGVMKHVGDAMHEYSSWNDNDKNIYEHDGQEDAKNEVDIPLIGFTTYHTLAPSIRTPIDDYMLGLREEVRIPAGAVVGRDVFLDKHHTHFVLVSSEENKKKSRTPGGKPAFGEEIELWADSEKYIIKQFTKSINSHFRKRKARSSSSREQNDTIPSVLISIQGGPGSLKTAVEHLKEGIPLVAIRSSGGWTDIISDFCKPDTVPKFIFDGEPLYIDAENQQKIACSQEKVEATSTEKDFQFSFEGEQAIIANIVVQKLQDYKMHINPRTKKKGPIKRLWLEQCIEVYNRRNLVTLFDLVNQNEDLDTAMMKAVLSAQASGHAAIDSRITKIMLAMQYNKAELVREELFHDDSAPLSDASMGEIFDQAIFFKKHQFIDMLLDMDFNIKGHITPSRLQLYYSYFRPNDSMLLYNYFMPFYVRQEWDSYEYKEKDFDILKTHLNQIERLIFGPEYELSYQTFTQRDLDRAVDAPIENPNPIENPLKEMLFWAALSGDFELVEVFYHHLARYEGGGILSALALVNIFREAGKRAGSIEFASELKEASKLYEKIAVEILAKAYRKARVQSAILVGIPRNMWGNLTPLKMAMSCKGKDFVSHQGFQEWLDIIWFYRVEPFMDLTGLCWFLLMVIFGWIPGVLNFSKFRNLPGVLIEHQKNVFLEKNRVTPNAYSRYTRSAYGGEATTAKSGSAASDMDSTASGDESSVVHKKPDKSAIKSKIKNVATRLENKIWQKDHKQLSLIEKIIEFYQAPVVTFTLNAIMVLVLVLAYAWFLMMDFCYVPNIIEIVVFIWMFATFADEVRQFHRSGGTFASRRINYFSDAWNYLDVLIIFVYSVANVMRIIAPFVDRGYEDWRKNPNWGGRMGYNVYQNCEKNGMATIERAGRTEVVPCDYNNFCPMLMGHDDHTDILFGALICHCIVFCLLCFRFANLFTISRSLGPLILTILRMMVDMGRFLILLVVFMVAFGVTSSALMYPNSWNGWKSVRNSFYRAYFTIYGELLLDEHSYDHFAGNSIAFETIQDGDEKFNWATHFDEVYIERGCYMVFAKPGDENDVCVASNTTNCNYKETDYTSILRCPQGRGFADVFLAFYMLFTNILLLNLLIALFTTTYDTAISQADQIWKYQRTGLVKEYRDRPTLPPPLIITHYVVALFRKMVQLFRYIFMSSNQISEKQDTTTTKSDFGITKPVTGSDAFSKRYTSEIIFNISDKLKRHLLRLERVSADDAWAERKAKREKDR